MGIKLFGVDISGIVKQSMASGLPKMTLKPRVNGTRSSSALTAGTNEKATSHDCRGFLDDYKDSQVDGTRIQKGDRFAVIIGDTLPAGVVPKPNDELVAEGSTWRIVDDGVKRDPAAATYTCHVRNR